MLSRASSSWITSSAPLQMMGARRASIRASRSYKENMSNQHEQKKDEARKKEAPKEGKKQEKQVNKYNYHWCEHHMAWTIHKPANCMLGKQHKEEQKKPQKANFATIAAAATTANPHFDALMATMANLED